MGRLFGTDGARGIANIELTCELAMQVGRAAAAVLTKHTSGKAKILIGRDTRISSKMLEAALTAGLCSVGADVELIGVVPTPAVAYLVPKYEADAGIMISASHNPVEYNGIKLFSKTGYKLSDELENEIEALIFDKQEAIVLKSGIEIGRVYTRKSAVSDYIESIRRSIDTDLSGVEVAIDCANGSASATADQLFRELGANAHLIHCNPNGMNINDKCGSTNLDALIYYMKQHNIDIGVAFDGDADRCLAVDENGNRVDGDQLIAIFAKDLKDSGKLKNNTAVVTVMSNFGMQKFGADNGISFISTAVGDRYVLEEMVEGGYNLGGEDSGHIIFKDFAQTGDGQLSAVQLLRIYKKTGKKLSELAKTMTKSPQVARGIAATQEDKERYTKDEEITATIDRIKAALGNAGRVLVRASGTEPLIRVMLEGNDYKVINEYCGEICDVLEKRLHA